MKLATILLVAALAIPFASADYTVSQDYVAAGGDAVILDCGATLGTSVGGACFDLSGDEISVVITATDDSTLPVCVYVSVRDGADTQLQPPSIFTNSGTVPIPADAARVLVFLDQALAPLDCGLGVAPATAGTITAAFTTI